MRSLRPSTSPSTVKLPPAAATADFVRPGAEAMRRHGVRHIVAVTTLGRDTGWQDRVGNATGSIRMVDLLRTTGAAVRGLALPAFMDNALQQVDAIRQGKMFGVIDPDKKLPHTAARDTGAVVSPMHSRKDMSICCAPKMKAWTMLLRDQRPLLGRRASADGPRRY